MPNKNLDNILQKLEALEAEREAEKQVRLCMNQYMALCDNLDAGFDLSTLMVLFSKDAIWQGAGKRYAKTFGRYEGKSAIADMFEKYTKPPAHFELNAHFLCNEVIDVNIVKGTATGSWMLIQPSTFSSGKSQLSCARISAEFMQQKNAWLISSFTTQNIFSRPMAEPWDNPAPLAVPTKAPIKGAAARKSAAAKERAATKKTGKKAASRKKTSTKKIAKKARAKNK